MTHEVKSFCRTCTSMCATIVTVDDDDRLIAVRGDRDDPQTLGYACFKGLQAPESHNSPDRILRPLKRQADGSFKEIGLETALDEIADRLGRIHAEYGGEAIGGYRGGGGFFTTSATFVMRDWLQALGSHKMFSPDTIDQSAKFVSVCRIGIWPGGRTAFSKSDVFLLVGGNPLVSNATIGFDTRNPVKRLKDAKARGMKLIVIDPRRTETAAFADLFLQPLPGEDASVLAGILRIILAEGWEDKAFVDEHLADIDKLRLAVAPFTPDYVAARADIPAEQLHAAADLFARQNRTGPATSATGANMGPHSNLVEHLVETLNVVCGRYRRVGEDIGNPGVMEPRWPRPARVIPARRPWEQGPKSRIGGYGMFNGEMMTGILADELLEPGPGKVRAFFNHGGNPASAVPDQRKMVRALRGLDLLVSIEPFMSVTAQLSDYILPPKLQYERADMPMTAFETMAYPEEPYARYTPPIAASPPGSELVDDVYVFWALSKRLGIQMRLFDIPIPMDRPPTVDDFLRIVARHAPVTLDEIKAHPGGFEVPLPRQVVEPAAPDPAAKFTVMPDDVMAEMAELASEPLWGGSAADGMGFTHRLSVRRTREIFNSTYRQLPGTRKRISANYAFMNPGEMAMLGIAENDRVSLTSDTGEIHVVARGDATVRAGVVSISHGFGGLPDEAGDYARDGASCNLLISTDRDLQAINAMPRMTAVPIRVARLG